MAELPKETNYWEEAEEFFSKNKENITPGTTVIFKEKIIDVKSDFDDKAFIDLVMKVNPDGETFSLIPLLYNDEFEAKNPDIKPKAISMTEYFNDDIDRSFMAQIRLGDFTEDIIRLKEHYNIPLSKQEGDYLGEILGDSLDEADITDIVPEEELVVAPDDISSIDTPTNVVDDVPVGGVREEPFFNFGDNIDIPLQINKQGNVILYRTTDSPDYLQVSDFTQKNTSDIGTLGFGQHTYFGPNVETPQAFWVASTNRGLYKYDTNIKPNEIFIGNIGDKPELAKALGIPEQYWNMNYHRFLIETKDTYRKVLTDNIETFKKYGIKALGRYGGTSGEKSFEIIPLITNEDNLGVKAVAELEPIKGIGKGGAANWKVKEVITDTPTNIAGAEVIDEVERIQRETIEKLRNANDEFVAEQIDNIMARKINEVLPFVDTSLSRAEAIGISTTGTQITTSADPTLNTFIDEIEKITGQTIDIYDKRKLRQFMYDVAKGKDNLLNDKKSFKFNLQDGVDNSNVDNSLLYTQPEEVAYAYEELSKISNRFTIAAAFGNVHGVYKPGNVKLTPVILKNSQDYIQQKFNTSSNPVDFVFHGGSGSSLEEIREAIGYGVIKMNIDTDLQYAYMAGVRDYMDEKKDYLQGQIGNPDGADSPNKKFYDPRVWVRKGEDSFKTRIKQAFQDLNNVDTL